VLLTVLPVAIPVVMCIEHNFHRLSLMSVVANVIAGWLRYIVAANSSYFLAVLSSVFVGQKQAFANWLNGDFSVFCCFALSYLSMISLVWLVELEFPLVPRPLPSGPRGRWHAQGGAGGQDQQGGWVGQKKTLSARVFAGVASVTARRPAAVVLWFLHSAPLLLEQRARLAVLPFFCLAHQSLVCVQKKVLSVRVFAGVASVTGSTPAAVRPHAPSQRAPSLRATSPACGPPFFLPCALISCVRSARQMCAQNKRLPS